MDGEDLCERERTNTSMVRRVGFVEGEVPRDGRCNDVRISHTEINKEIRRVVECGMKIGGSLNVV